jgi:dephospho-CoA kinase
MKRLLLVTSPPACGKTFVSKELARALNPIVYLDKDTLIVLSKQIFVVANQEFNRSSAFFEANIRNYEYDAIVNLALESLDYSPRCLINAPFTREVRNVDYMRALRAKLREKGAILTVVWVKTDPEVVHQRMIKRNSERDTWKIQNWDAYNAGVNYSIPETLNDRTVTDEFFVVNNNGQEELRTSLAELVAKLQD